MPQRAPFIVIEGLDRSGKTTQTSLLFSHLQSSGYTVALLKFPDRTTPIGKMIDSYLRSQSDLDDHAIHLLFSGNRWELSGEIESHLRNKTIVVCDRYAFSGIAFSACPDLTIFLDITPEKARERGGYGEERYEKEEMQRKVREIFKRLGSETSSSMNTRWEVIDAGRDQETIAKEIWSHVEKIARGLEGEAGRPAFILNQKRHSPVRPLAFNGSQSLSKE